MSHKTDFSCTLCLSVRLSVSQSVCLPVCLSITGKYYLEFSFKCQKFYTSEICLKYLSYYIIGFVVNLPYLVPKFILFNVMGSYLIRSKISHDYDVSKGIIYLLLTAWLIISKWYQIRSSTTASNLATLVRNMNIKTHDKWHSDLQVLNPLTSSTGPRWNHIMNCLV